ncbi:hypothetical protein S301_08560 [Salmonella enterica subsp. enterica]|uniref:Uncharacterized protein n=1 Tax=Salmonella enterica I TaxID=59201 RepID=A0A5U3EP63_SALET|nr:hypothetical protein [Salmonella enterica subsp. enterica]
MGWIGVDFDGVLATWSPGQGKKPGEPVDAMVERVRKWVRDGYDVRIFTARAGDAAQVKVITAWLKKHQLPALAVTNVKSPGLMEMWDDKAVRVVSNTGAPCSSCAGYSRLSRQDIKTDC